MLIIYLFFITLVSIPSLGAMDKPRVTFQEPLGHKESIAQANTCMTEARKKNRTEEEKLSLLTKAARLFEPVYKDKEADSYLRFVAQSNLEGIYARYPQLQRLGIARQLKQEDKKIIIPSSTNSAHKMASPKPSEEELSDEEFIDAYFEEKEARKDFSERVFSKELTAVRSEKEAKEEVVSEIFEEVAQQMMKEISREEISREKTEIKKANKAKVAEEEKAAAQKAAEELEAQKKVAEMKTVKEKAAAEKASKEKTARKALQKQEEQKKRDAQDPEKMLIEACKTHITKKEYAQASQGYWQLLQTSKDKTRRDQSKQELQKLYAEKKDSDAAYYMAILNHNIPTKMVAYFIEAENHRDIEKEKKESKPVALQAKKTLQMQPPDSAIVISNSVAMSDAVEYLLKLVDLQKIGNVKVPQVFHALATHFYNQAQIFPDLKMDFLQQAKVFADKAQETEIPAPAGCVTYARVANNLGMALFEEAVALSKMSSRDRTQATQLHAHTTQAAELFKTAISKSSVEGTYNLGQLQEYRFNFLEKFGNLDAALLNYQQALSEGHTPAQERIESLLIEGTQGTPLNGAQRKTLFAALKEYAPKSSLLEKREYNKSAYYQAAQRELVPGNSEYFEGLYWLDQGETECAMKLLKIARDDKKNKAASITMFDIGFHDSNDAIKLKNIKEYFGIKNSIPFHARMILSESLYSAYKEMIGEGNGAAPYLCIEALLMGNIEHIKAEVAAEICQLLDEGEKLQAIAPIRVPFSRLITPRFIADVIKLSHSDNTPVVLQKIATIAQNRLQKKCAESEALNLKHLIENMSEAITDLEKQSQNTIPEVVETITSTVTCEEPSQTFLGDIPSKPKDASRAPALLQRVDQPRSHAKSSSTVSKDLVAEKAHDDFRKSNASKTLARISKEMEQSINSKNVPEAINGFRTYLHILRKNFKHEDCASWVGKQIKNVLKFLYALPNLTECENLPSEKQREFKLLLIAHTSFTQSNYNCEAALKAFCAEHPIYGPALVARELASGSLFAQDKVKANSFIKQALDQAVQAGQKSEHMAEVTASVKFVDSAPEQKPESELLVQVVDLEKSKELAAQPTPAVPSDAKKAQLQKIKDDYLHKHFEQEIKNAQIAMTAKENTATLVSMGSLLKKFKDNNAQELYSLLTKNHSIYGKFTRMKMVNTSENINFKLFLIAEKAFLEKDYDIEAALKEICASDPGYAPALIARAFAMGDLFGVNNARAEQFLDQAKAECEKLGKKPLMVITINNVEATMRMYDPAAQKPVSQETDHSKLVKRTFDALQVPPLTREDTLTLQNIAKYQSQLLAAAKSNDIEEAVRAQRKIVYAFRANPSPALKHCQQILTEANCVTQTGNNPLYSIELEIATIAEKTIASEKYDYETALKDLCARHPVKAAAMIAREFTEHNLFAQDVCKADEFLKRAIQECYQSGNNPTRDEYLAQTIGIVQAAKIPQNSQPPLLPIPDKEKFTATTALAVQAITSLTQQSNNGASGTNEAELRQDFETGIKKATDYLDAKFPVDSVGWLIEILKRFRTCNEPDLYFTLKKEYEPFYNRFNQLEKANAKNDEDRLTNLLTVVGVQLLDIAEKKFLDESYDIEPKLKKICKSYPGYGAGIIARFIASNLFQSHSTTAQEYLKQARKEANKTGGFEKQKLLAFLTVSEESIQKITAPASSSPTTVLPTLHASALEAANSIAIQDPSAIKKAMTTNADIKNSNISLASTSTQLPHELTSLFTNAETSLTRLKEAVVIPKEPLVASPTLSPATMRIAKHLIAAVRPADSGN